MKKINLVILLVFAIVIYAHGWRGESKGYFQAEKFWRTKAEKCPELSTEGGTCNLGKVVVTMKVDSNAVATIFASTEGKSFNYKLSDYKSGNMEVYSSELTHDNLPDLIIVRSRGGNGLGSEICDVVFFASDGGSYYFTTFKSFGFDKMNIISVDGKMRIVQTLFVQKNQGYWVNRYFVVGEGKLSQDKVMGSTWVKYTSKPKNTVTSELPISERDSLLQALLADGFYGP